MRASLGLALCALLSPRPVSAQTRDDSVTLDPYRAAELGTDGFAVPRPITLLPRTYSARLTLDYGRGSLAFDAAGTANDYVVVRNQLVGTVGVAFAASERITVAVGLPLNVVMNGDRAPLPGVGLAEADGRVTGDPYVTARARIVGHEGDTFVLGAQLRLTLPIAASAMTTSHYAGDSSTTVQPSVLAELTFDRLRLNGVLGGRFRGVERQRDLTVGQELTYALGVSYAVIEDRLAIVGEAYGSTDLRVLGRSSGSPLELIAGARVQANDDWNLGAAVGTRLTQGYGASDFRGVLTVAYAPTRLPTVVAPEPAAPPDTDADDDGIDDATDHCPAVAEDGDEFEDADGCPDPDNDGDGVVDADDAQPYDAEDVDGFEDADGAPDPDDDGDAILDADDRCRSAAEDADGLLDQDGCPETDADDDAVLDADDHCPMTPGAATNANADCAGCPASACIDPNGSIRILDRIEFENGRDVIREESAPVLESVRAILATTDSIRRVRIEGHTDDRGNDQRNLTLSEQRAAAVRAWLVAHGIVEARLEAAGLGETRPIADNHTAPGRAQNRRVEFHIVDPAPATATP